MLLQNSRMSDVCNDMSILLFDIQLYMDRQMHTLASQQMTKAGKHINDALVILCNFNVSFLVSWQAVFAPSSARLKHQRCSSPATRSFHRSQSSKAKEGVGSQSIVGAWLATPSELCAAGTCQIAACKVAAEAIPSFVSAPPSRHQSRPSHHHQPVLSIQR